MKNIIVNQIDYRRTVATPKTLSSPADTSPHRHRRETHTIRAAPKEAPKLRVAAYCRVSTDQDSQETSIENQKDHYERYIRNNPEWQMAGIYWEVGVTGTKTEKRPELNRLMEDCRAGKIDLILTKSISRFSRNTTDCLQLVRKLTSLGVRIVFEKENIRTGTMESELLLTLFSSMAEEESHSISSNSVWSVKKRFASGTFRYSKAPYGYELHDGTFEIVPEEAAVVREIFSRVLAGEGTPSIAKALNERQIPTGTRTRSGEPGRWSAAMIRGIITNITYTGDVLMQKTWHDREYRCLRNYGEKAQYYMDDHHEPIIDKKTFELAGHAHRQRGREKGNIPMEDRRKRDNPHSRRNHFSGKFVCGICGAKMRRVAQYTASGTRWHWSCMAHLEDRSACPMKRVSEQDLEHAFCTLLNKLHYASVLLFDDYLADMQANIMVGDLPATRLYRQKILDNAAVREEISQNLSRGLGDPARYWQKLLELSREEAELKEEITRIWNSETGLDSIIRLKNDAARFAFSPDDADIAALFAGNVDCAAVTAEKEAVFHMKCGFIFREPLVRERR